MLSIHRFRKNKEEILQGLKKRKIDNLEVIDRVIELELGKYIRAYKNVTTNEPFFIGHFPGKQVMPGVLILEAMAQASGILGFNLSDSLYKSFAFLISDLKCFPFELFL